MKGIIFTIDALFAMMIVVASVPLVIMIAARPGEVTDQPLKVYAESAIYSLSELRIRNVMKEKVIADMYASGAITDDDLDRHVIDKVLELWTSNSTENETMASNMTEHLIAAMLPNMSAMIAIENETVFDSSMPSPIMVSTGRRVASGYMKGNRSTGYISSVFLTAIGGRRGSSYFFFGGFSGQGNLTVAMDDIPLNSTPEEIYMEISTAGNFTLYVNSQKCGTFNKTSDPIQITANCTGYVVPGSQNVFSINFTSANVSTSYFGGGFLRVTYVTNQLATDETYSKKFYPGGISGIINYFGSVYVNGNITSMEMKMHLFNNYTTIINIGNRTVLNSTGNSSDQLIYVSNATIGAMIDYRNISMATVPLRIVVSVPNITDIAQEGDADVILITDVSGSMAYQMGSDSYGTDRACTDSQINATTTTRLSLAKCIDKDFVAAILGGMNNRIGLVSFSTNADNYVNLTTNFTLLNATISAYSSTTSTCLSCAINRAYSSPNATSAPLSLRKYSSCWLNWRTTSSSGRAMLYPKLSSTWAFCASSAMSGRFLVKLNSIGKVVCCQSR